MASITLRMFTVSEKLADNMFRPKWHTVINETISKSTKKNYSNINFKLMVPCIVIQC